MQKMLIYCVLLSLLATSHINTVVADTLHVNLQTTVGDIHIELYPDAAPITVENFLKYVDGGYYTGAHFYRVVRMDNQAQNNIKIEVIQGGLDKEPEDLPFKPIAHESTQSTGILHQDGTISMARLEPGSAQSEFFICINDQPELDFGGQRNPDGQGFAAFGKVTEGMDVVRLIQGMQTDTPPDQQLEYTSGQMLESPVSIKGIIRSGSQ